MMAKEQWIKREIYYLLEHVHMRLISHGQKIWLFCICDSWELLVLFFFTRRPVLFVCSLYLGLLNVIGKQWYGNLPGNMRYKHCYMSPIASWNFCLGNIPLERKHFEFHRTASVTQQQNNQNFSEIICAWIPNVLVPIHGQLDVQMCEIKLGLTNRFLQMILKNNFSYKNESYYFRSFRIFDCGIKISMVNNCIWNYFVCMFLWHR